LAIRVLPPEIASRIAAGEVIERPSSVVKELVENSLDAGATRIHIEVQGGGIRFIQVTDNGCGIPPEEVELALQRHATSKLAAIEDLERLTTLGFRGEALPSIASVAEVAILTRVADSPVGSYIHIRDGKTVQKASRGSPIGSTVTMRNLFRSVPARLKFLKSPVTESERIATLVSNYAMAYPGAKFTLLMDGRRSLDTPGNGSVLDAAAAIYGGETARSLLAVSCEERASALYMAMTLKGYISPPSLTRANRQYISFFVNGRWIQSRVLTYALEQAYQGFLPTGRHPIALLNLSIPSEEVDCNVHPAKSEVRFRNEGAIFTLVQKGVREALLRTSPIPGLLDRSTVPSPSWQARPLSQQPPSAGAVARNDSETKAASPLARSVLPVLRVVGQVASTYIVAEGPDGLYLIDQHAAHERVIFDRLRSSREPVQLQGLLEPAVVELTPAQDALLQKEAIRLKEMGFTPEAFGERSYLLRAIPASLSRNGPARALQELLDGALAEEAGYDQAEKLGITFACHSAVRAGDSLSQKEMEELARQLEDAALPNTCPHGRPTLVHLSADHLEREFGRR